MAFISVTLVLKLPKREASSWKSKLRRVDFPGALVLVCAVFSLLLGLDRGSNVSWSVPIALVPLCVSIPLFGLFVLVEQRYALEPFAPGRIIFERSLFACYLCNFFSFAGWYVILDLLTLAQGLLLTFTGSQQFITCRYFGRLSMASLLLKLGSDFYLA